MELRTAYDIIEQNLGIFVTSKESELRVRFINEKAIRGLIPKDLWDFLVPQIDAFFSYFVEDFGIERIVEEYRYELLSKTVLMRIKNDIILKIQETYQEDYMAVLKWEFRKAYLE